MNLTSLIALLLAPLTDLHAAEAMGRAMVEFFEGITRNANETKTHHSQNVCSVIHRAHGARADVYCHRLGGGNAKPEAG